MPLARWSAAHLATGGGVQVGIRPEELVLTHGESGPGARLRGTVVAVEPLGAETLVAVELAGGAGELTARLHRDTAVGRGEEVTLSVPEPALYLFDGASGKAIPARGAA